MKKVVVYRKGSDQPTYEANLRAFGNDNEPDVAQVQIFGEQYNVFVQHSSELRERLHKFIDRQLDEIEKVGSFAGSELHIEMPEELEAEATDGPERLWLAICNLDHLGWALSEVWARTQLNIDTEPTQVQEIFEERIQELYQEYLGRTMFYKPE